MIVAALILIQTTATGSLHSLNILFTKVLMPSVVAVVPIQTLFSLQDKKNVT